MSSSADSYSNGIYKLCHARRAAWPPNTKLRLGDIGLLEGNLFQYRTNLDSMGIYIESNRPGYLLDEMNHSSGYNYKLNASISGQAIAAGSVGMGAEAEISFDSSGAFVFQAIGCREYEIANKDKLANEIRNLYKEGRWNPDWVVIETLMEVEKATIIVANSEGAHLKISATGGFPAGNVPLVRAQGVLSVTSQSGDYTAYFAAQGLTPMFRLFRVKRSWLEIIKDIFSPKFVPVTEATLPEALDFL